MVIIALFIAVTILLGDTAASAYTWLFNTIGDTFGWFYLLAVNVFIITLLYFAFSKYGNIRIGGVEAEKEFSDFSWMAMLFSAGMGIGLMFFSVSEPLYYFQNPPSFFGAEAGTGAAASAAMAQTFFHWGFHPWAVYGLVGLGLAFFSFNRGLRSQVLPMEDINLHFTGDLHALTSAHNLIAAMLDAKISQGDDLNIDINNVSWPRAIDMNDRALRETVVGLGGKTGGTPREDSFLLTAASELMAVLCLASDLGDLKERVSRIIVAYDEDGDPVTVEDIEATGPATMLLRDAIKPNVVQTIEGTPALVHGGPFANIAHGTNSLVADKTAFGMGDYLVTEAGFGSDLGAEKFMDVVCRKGDMTPNAVVLVASVRALKYHGLDQWPVDYDEIDEAGVEAVEAGFSNLDKHATNLQKFGVPVVVSVNRFPDDTDEEIQAILDHCREDLGVRAAESNVFSDGSEGGVDLAENVIEATEESNEEDFRMLYDDEDSIKEKIHTVATGIYGADDVKYTGGALDDIEQMNELDFDDYPVVMSKTFHSLSDDASQKGAPEGWELEISEVYPSAGAGFLVALTADALTMPGLPARPAAADMDIDEDGNISGLF
ncbi:formate--tetrahydrofolate ligase [Haloarcula hispanica]|uniref:Formate--tetrahydrofolate ligase n=1 Tax=Haloarcula hispanica TaxID=51589 RepID=A0A482SZP5_HALHI|nr:formate--tetrahydrofolate ligase [Haloarcula hispanica]